MHKAKKSLGQNFLKSESALRKIVEAGEVKNGDTILEIGPGKGALTEKLLETEARIIAVEKDRELFEFLETKFEKQITEEKLILLNEDILDFNMEQKTSRDYKIIANIPYNITGAILKKFLTSMHQPDCMILMVQHEVATRILARDGKESILSISVKAYGEPKLVGKVEKRYFSPTPKVDSAIISIKNISRIFFSEKKISEEKFWEIVKKGFAHKRKKLAGNLKGVLPKEILAPFKDKRAEDLTLADWSTLTE